MDFNTSKRKNAGNSFEKDFFKLMNNSVFFKTMENLRKRVSVKLVNNAKDYVRYISKPSFKHRISAYDVCKISLSCFDDKRYVLNSGINSLAYFLKDIKFIR